MEDFKKQLEQTRQRVEDRLASFFTGGGLEEAMRYSLLAGGKRLRPILTIKFCEAAGGFPEDALDYGCGLEMLHTYSLIHDDLPCMDDDDLRRGKPTCHKVFGECTAVLAGDALQAAAFRTILSAGGDAGRAALILAEAVGEQGMCGGQYWDTVGNGTPHTSEELAEIDRKKTGALLRAACEMGVVAAMRRNSVDERCLEAARNYAENVGLAFQIRDDMLDVISTEQELGKPIGSDASNEKATYVSLLGLDGCNRRVHELTERAKAALDGAQWPGGTEFLRELADSLTDRIS